jgi:hypothetical protein
MHSPPDAGDDDVRQPANVFEHLPPRLPADHGLELADHQRIRMWSERGPQKIVRITDVGDPVPHGLVDRILQRLATGIDLTHRRAQELHAQDIRGLTPHVLGAHVHMALEAEQCTRGRARDAVLSGASLGDDTRLAHA